MVKVKKTVRHKRYFSRLCKKRDIQRLNRDAVEIAGGLYDSFLQQLLDRMEHMSGNNKTITRKVAQLAFMSVLNDANSPDQDIQMGLQFADASYKALNASE